MTKVAAMTMLGKNPLKYPSLEPEDQWSSASLRCALEQDTLTLA